ncbi:MAG TPA: GNAT family N-acetyltransferase [Candidatus Limnocylindrales bacterium]
MHPIVRPAIPEDLAPCTEVWREAIGQYLGRLNMPPPGTDLAPLRRLLAHLLATDPDRFWVAADPVDARIVGFGSASVRGNVWFLAMLFVEPTAQRAGLGRALLARTLPEYPGLRPGSAEGGRAMILATATDSAQPVSNGLYSRLSIVPRVPVFHLLGRPDGNEMLPPLPGGVRPVAFLDLERGPGDPDGAARLGAALAAVDRAVLGYEHPADHAYLAREERIGFLYLGPNDRPLGYAYAARSGRVGPIAAVDEGLLGPLLGHVLDAVVPPDASSAWVPGAAGAAFAALVRAGFRVDGFPALLCWTEPWAAFERYVPSSLALV